MSFKDLSGKTGINELMKDLGGALQDENTNIKYMFGGGNPAHIPEIEETIYEIMNELLTNKAEFFKLIGDYDTPQGYLPFLKTLASFFNETITNKTQYAFTEKNVATTCGSQNAMFILQNLFTAEGKKILLPLVPEYIGYMDQIVSKDKLEGVLGIIDLDETDRTFKYRIDFEEVEKKLATSEFSCMIISRPTNPTGNVITDNELTKLVEFAKKYDTYLILDNAYGYPWPNAINVENEIFYDDNVILSFSLSKIGMPMGRVGVILANKRIIEKIKNVNAIISLSTPNIAQYIFNEILKKDGHNYIKELTNSIKSFYLHKAELANEVLTKSLDKSFKWFLHRHEGSFFFWLYLPGIKKSSDELYEILKENSVLVVPSKYYYTKDLVHKDEAHKSIRINFARSEEEITEGMKKLAEVINSLH